MNRYLCRLFAVASCAAMLATTGMAQADTEIQWSQVTDVPKGANLPSGVSVDILGIQPGDTYEEVKAKLEQMLAAEGDDVTSPGIQEYRYQIYLPRPNGERISALYIGRAELTLNRPTNSDTIKVSFSAPSSGQQAVAIDRLVIYRNQTDQPRISNVLQSLSEKLGGHHIHSKSNDTLNYKFRYDDGNAVETEGPYSMLECGPVGATMNYDEASAAAINEKGDCDVVLAVQFNIGISDDHADAIWFMLGDNERAKTDFMADYKFFHDYVKELQNSAGGAGPKL